jgi:hypothetical protein
MAGVWAVPILSGPASGRLSGWPSRSLPEWSAVTCRPGHFVGACQQEDGRRWAYGTATGLAALGGVRSSAGRSLQLWRGLDVASVSVRRFAMPPPRLSTRLRGPRRQLARLVISQSGGEPSRTGGLCRAGRPLSGSDATGVDPRRRKIPDHSLRSDVAEVRFQKLFLRETKQTQ